MRVIWCWLLAAVIATTQGRVVASPIALSNREGTAHGFVEIPDSAERHTAVQSRRSAAAGAAPDRTHGRRGVAGALAAVTGKRPRCRFPDRSKVRCFRTAPCVWPLAGAGARHSRRARVSSESRSCSRVRRAPERAILVRYLVVTVGQILHACKHLEVIADRVGGAKIQ
jgi:hypothetical protein